MDGTDFLWRSGDARKLCHSRCLYGCFILTSRRYAHACCGSIFLARAALWNLASHRVPSMDSPAAHADSVRALRLQGVRATVVRPVVHTRAQVDVLRRVTSAATLHGALSLRA